MLHQLLTKGARTNPKRAAIVVGEAEISYSMLLDAVEAFAVRLADEGVEAGDCVALLFDEGAPFIIALFAAARIGACSLPLSPRLGDETLAQYLDDTQARVLLTGHSQLSRGRELQARSAVAEVHALELGALLEAGAGELGPRLASLPPASAFAGHGALYLYTSGSQGYKKRICRTQRNLGYEATNFVRSAALGPEDTVVCLVPLYHSYGLGNGLLAALAAGSSLVLLEHDDQGLPFAARGREVLATVERVQARLLIAVSHQYDALAQLDGDGREQLASVRLCVSSAGRLPMDVYRRFEARWGHAIRQLYGSTETGSVAANLDPDEALRPELVGRPLANVELRIIDEDGAAVPTGEVGEILVASPVLPPGGYDGRPEDSARAFVDGYYHSGDYGCLDAAGRLRIVGRKQTFIETSGYKVDPSKVEAVLLAHAAVREAVVLGIPTPGLGQRVEAVVTLEPAAADVDASALVGHCRIFLAGYEVPVAVEIRTSLPRSALGKVLKHELLAARGVASAEDHSFALAAIGGGFAWQPCPIPEPGPGDVLVEVLAASVSLVDLLLARGLAPEAGSEREADAGPRLGAEACGRVVSVGEGVEGLVPGDDVIVLYPGCLARHVCAPAQLVGRRPSTLTIEEAAALPFAPVHAHQARSPREREPLSFAGGLTSSLLELRERMLERPQELEGPLREVLELAATGAYRPLVARCVPGSEVEHALAMTTHEGARGNIVVDLRDRQIGSALAARREELAPPRPRPRAKAGLVRQIRAEVAGLLDLDASTLSTTLSFRSLGLNSLNTVMLQTRLSQRLDLDIPAPLVWDHPSIEALAEALAARQAAAEGERPAARSGPPRRQRRATTALDDPALDGAIAVVGIGCRLPGGVRSVEDYWELLCAGVDAIEARPESRGWTDRDIPPCGGFLDAIEDFDAAFFNINAREAAHMDPQQRVLLEVAWEALEDGALAPSSLRGSQTGVFVGISFSDYGLRALYSSDHAVVSPYSTTGATSSSAAGRIAYCLGFHGPCFALDTACSSSLTTIHLACQSLRAGECERALAGGVNLMVEPHPSLTLQRMDVLAPDGRCKPFDDSANGIVRSEGCGMVVLQPLREALAEGARVYAVIRGSALNHDGSSNGLTAPNGLAQRALLREALHEAGVEPRAIGYIEAHAAGTPLGDPIEAHALGEVLGRDRCADQPVIVGSVKSQIGHTEACAGVAGFIKAVLSVERGLIPATLHVNQPNTRIAWDRLPLHLATRATRWDDEPRLAGVSAFGFSGTNAHVILQQAPARE